MGGLFNMRSLKEKRIYDAKGLESGKWYKLYAEGEKEARMLFQFSECYRNDVYDVKSYHYDYCEYYEEDDMTICFRFLDRVKYYCVSASDEDVLKYFDSI